MYYYEVAPNRIFRADKATYTYSHDSKLSLGQLVKITVGKVECLGLVVSNAPKPEYETKPIINILDLPPLPKPIVDTALWMSDYYTTHLSLVLQTILPQGLTTKRREKQIEKKRSIRNRTNFVLNKYQQKALSKINKVASGTVMLHGVTGSGKTAVYTELAKQTIASGKSVIVLTPEISLTPQIFDEFAAHFDNIILTHSRQTEAERHLAWQSALNNDKPAIAMGPRSALFMPLKDIGLIIIDEAHEPSYKQDQSPRYSALRVASVLAKLNHSKVIQGTATPLISEYYLASTQPDRIVTIDKKARTDTVLPDVTIVDMKARGNFNKHRLFSDIMLAKITEAVGSGHQALIFHNRRGSATTTLCQNCGWSATCPRCFVPLTLHADHHHLRCHICDFTSRVPFSCPDCGESDIIHKGIGTKLIESELKKIFPDKLIMRFDGDNKKVDSLEKNYDKLYSGEVQIIIGTQVVAKGLDLPKLRSVSIVQADAGLALPDFATNERAFDLVSQVVGRVGRDNSPTSVVIQSYQPTAEPIQLGSRSDYSSFYLHEIAQRQKSKFPPFRYLAKFTAVYKTQKAAIDNSKKIAKLIRASHPEVEVLGPTPYFYEKQHGTYRWQLVVRSKKRQALIEATKSVPSQNWQIDIDPSSLI